MKVKQYLYSLLFVGGLYAMEEQKESATSNITVTQMATKSLDQIQKIYPNAESVLRAATIDDLPATVNILEKIKAPKEEIVQILATMEEEVYKEKKRLSSDTTYIIDNINIKKLSDFMASFGHDLVTEFSEEHFQQFRKIFYILNVQKKYSTQDIDDKYHHLHSVLVNLEEYAVAFNDGYDYIIDIPNLQNYQYYLRMCGLVGVQGTYSPTMDVLQSGRINENLVYPELSDLNYINYVKTLSLFF